MKYKLIEREDYYNVFQNRMYRKFQGGLFIFDNEFEEKFRHTYGAHLESWTKMLEEQAEQRNGK